MLHSTSTGAARESSPMDTQDTKDCLAKVLVELSAKKLYAKVSVAYIISIAGKNRAAFYYHFV